MRNKSISSRIKIGSRNKLISNIKEIIQTIVQIINFNIKIIRKLQIEV